MGKFKMGGHTLKGPNQKPSVGKNRDIFKTYFDEDGKEKTKQISKQEMADIQAEAEKNNELLNTNVTVGNYTTTTSGDDNLNNEYPNATYNFTNEDAAAEIQSNIDSGNSISNFKTNEELLKGANEDVNKLKNTRLKTGYGSKSLQNISNQGGTRSLNQGDLAQYQNNTFTASDEDIEDASELKNKDTRTLNLHDFNALENQRLNDAYRSTTGGKGGPSKKMKFGRKKK